MGLEIHHSVKFPESRRLLTKVWSTPMMQRSKAMICPGAERKLKVELKGKMAPGLPAFMKSWNELIRYLHIPIIHLTERLLIEQFRLRS